jgi:hypothetical protein
MTAAERRITPTDILPPAQYAAERRERRAAMMALKRARRVEIGPFCTFTFENYDTMWQQVHEMLHAEKGGAAQLEDELSAYNPLIPQGAELVATMMIEIEDPVRRGKLLRQLTNIEEAIYLDVGGKRIAAAPERDAERTAPDGKTSSVHFVRFRFAPVEIAAFKAGEAPVVLGLAHANYSHMAVLSSETRIALAADFA